MKLFKTAFFVFFIFSNIAFTQKFSDELSKLPIIKGCEKFKFNSNTMGNVNCMSKSLTKQLGKNSSFNQIFEELYLFDYPINEKTSVKFQIDKEKKIVNSRSYIKNENVLMSIYGLRSFNKVKNKYNENGYIFSSAIDLENKPVSVEFVIPIRFVIEETYRTKWKKFWKNVKTDRLLIKQGGNLKLYLLKSDNSFLLTKKVKGQEKELQKFKNRSEIQYSEFLYELLNALDVQNYTSDDVLKNKEYYQHLVSNGYKTMLGTEYEKCTSKIQVKKLWSLNISNLGRLQEYYLPNNEFVERKELEKCKDETITSHKDERGNLIIESKLFDDSIRIYKDTKQSKLAVYKVIENNEEELIKEFSYLYELKDTPYEKILFKK